MLQDAQRRVNARPRLFGAVALNAGLDGNERERTGRYLYLISGLHLEVIATFGVGATENRRGRPPRLVMRKRYVANASELKLMRLCVLAGLAESRQLDAAELLFPQILDLTKHRIM